jgi:SpoIID/LytB domain protein
MSQIGAYGLAKQGYDYQQILNRYYPGVSLARVVLKQ